MTPEQFQNTDPLLDKLAEELGNWIESTDSSKVRETLAELSKLLGGRSISLEMTVGVLDSERGNTLPLLQMGLSSRWIAGL